MKLTGKQCEELQKALISAFADKDRFRVMLRTEMDIGSEVLQGESYDIVVFNFIQWAETRGVTNDLVKAACRANSYNLDLYEFAKNIGLKEEVDRQKSSGKISNLKDKDSKRQARIAALSEKDLVYSVQGLEAEEAYLRIKHWLEQNDGYAYSHFIEREFTKFGATSAVQLFISERNLLNRASSKRIEIKNEIKLLEKALKKTNFGLGTGLFWGFYAFAICSVIPFLWLFASVIILTAVIFGMINEVNKDTEEKTMYRRTKSNLEYSCNYHTAREILGEE